MRIAPLNAAKNITHTRKPATGKNAGSPPAASSDATSVMGVPQTELTTNVQRALLSLMGDVDQMRSDADRLRSRIRELESLADHDVMLPVLNRRAFLREVSRALALAERHDAPSALIFFDLNGFKAINDTYGHAAGDAALHHVSALLSAHVRETDAVGRLGGDEFGVVLTLTGREGAEAKAHELAELIASTPFQHDNKKLFVGAAWGSYPLSSGRNADQALAQADAAMYERKNAQKAKSTSSSS